MTDNLGLAVTTGQQRSWTRTIGNSNLDTYIVLVWSDPPSITGSSQVPLVNDLMLSVQKSDGSLLWRGNNFNQNGTGNNNGYSYTYPQGAASFNDIINNVEAIFIPAGTFAAGQQLLLSVGLALAGTLLLGAVHPLTAQNLTSPLTSAQVACNEGQLRRLLTVNNYVVPALGAPYNGLRFWSGSSGW